MREMLVGYLIGCMRGCMQVYDKRGCYVVTYL